MPFSLERSRELARRLLGVTAGDFRQSIEFLTAGEYDYTTQSAPQTSFTNTRCVVLDVTKEEIDTNEDVQIGDKRVICEFLDNGPIDADNTTCIIDGITHNIISVDDKFKVISIFICREL